MAATTENLCYIDAQISGIRLYNSFCVILATSLRFTVGYVFLSLLHFFGDSAFPLLNSSWWRHQQHWIGQSLRHLTGAFPLRHSLHQWDLLNIFSNRHHFFVNLKSLLLRWHLVGYFVTIHARRPAYSHQGSTRPVPVHLISPRPIPISVFVCTFTQTRSDC